MEANIGGLLFSILISNIVIAVLLVAIYFEIDFTPILKLIKQNGDGNSSGDMRSLDSCFELNISESNQLWMKCSNCGHKFLISDSNKTWDVGDFAKSLQSVSSINYCPKCGKHISCIISNNKVVAVKEK